MLKNNSDMVAQVRFTPAQEEQFYTALVNKDFTYEGVFIAGVKTTGIFCRPSCTARKPAKQNVEYFATTKEAIVHGYRPCKVCRPMENPGQTPPFIETLTAKLAADPSVKIKDYDLRKMGIDPATARRWFLKNHGITFHAYQRMFRINLAYKKLQEGGDVLSAAIDSGYHSLSAFSDSFRGLFGVPPSKGKNKNVLYFNRIDTPLGPMLAGATAKGICLLEFTDRKMLQTEIRDLTKFFDATVIQSSHPHLDQLEKELNEYFDKQRTVFSVSLDTPGTAFQLRVWDELKAIPYGTTRSYKQQAIRIEQPTAMRAVARANGMNRVAIVVPCHRVIGENGHLTGYAGGIWRKKWLLDMEAARQ
jgi:AraC family transcriptional regulator of adaptative response/methylated-DNA-[protein]-cysteine methyltransferase